ncbi:hypothetical protein LCGC14_2375640 [marine sediment metagenome]|uniref:Uncharacterized protein n=1 Tax=marine sediment metagenome TaxID=412755 RepID=A0A0F9C2H3_9ZZZZ
MASNKAVWLRKCVSCGLEAYTTEDLERFRKGKRNRYGRMNICKKCGNQQMRDPLKYKPSRDRNSKKWNSINGPINDPKRIGFLGKQIRFKENPRTNVCSECGRGYPDELKQQTVMHHEKYDLRNPLAHTVELCHSCHTTLHHRERGKPLLMVSRK